MYIDMRLRPDFFPGNAEILWRAFTTKNISCYISYRQDILQQIKIFDEQLKLTPLVPGTCDRVCVKGNVVMTYNASEEGEGAQMR
jgi:hypothetical protein